MANKKELTIEAKLRALFDLQLIDSRIDEIRGLRGELPLEVDELENEIAGLNKKLEKMKEEMIQKAHMTVQKILQSKNIGPPAKDLLLKAKGVLIFPNLYPPLFSLLQKLMILLRLTMQLTKFQQTL